MATEPARLVGRCLTVLVSGESGKPAALRELVAVEVRDERGPRRLPPTLYPRADPGVVGRLLEAAG